LKIGPQNTLHAYQPWSSVQLTATFADVAWEWHAALHVQ